jgi:O-antigen/teichoic acid export membrane protein
MRPMKARGRAGIQVSWGLADQGFASATNFALTVVAGRLVGPEGLGVIYIGFAIYLLVLSFQRALVTDPMVVASAPLDPAGREAAGRAALSLVLVFGAASTVVMLVLGLFVPGSVGRGLLLFAPWMAFAMVQDFWRTLLFRDARGAAAAANDGIWLAGMAVAVAVVWPSSSDWAIVATWGAGAALGGLLGMGQTRVRPVRLATAWQWWRSEARALGRWLGIENALIAAQRQVLVVVLAGVLGARDVGGLRAMEAVFAPTTLLGEAVGLPGLPILSKSLAASYAAARRWALRLSAVTFVLVLAYLLVAGAVRTQLLSIVFGDSFRTFADLILPIGIGQLAFSAGSGFWLLAKAAQQGRALVFSRVVGSVTTLVGATVLAGAYGLAGAAWGMTIGTVVGAAVIAVLTRRAPDRHVPAEQSPAPLDGGMEPAHV